ncbi:MAG TPA: nucleoside kinase [Clostridia bacterium]|nr:MAG: Uridine kinase [Firmicutes bacterium ADurb.Bin146]HOD92456.1 nucleoside kinase [Clostridia bacterium]HQM38813.1 nucleoside kinase [Clostridia bacterium]
MDRIFNRKIDITTIQGIRTYRNTLQLILLKVLHDMFPHRKVKIEYSINKGCYCNIENVKITKEHIESIKRRVQDYIDKDVEIKEIYCTRQKAIELLKEHKIFDIAEALEYVNNSKVLIYDLDGFLSVFYSEVAQRTSYVDLFDIKPYEPGFIFFYPTRHKPYELPLYTEQNKLASVFGEFNRWGEILGIPDVKSLNKIVRDGSINDIILASEALQDIKLGEISQEICDKHMKFIMIAGPSSSGKTTFANRLRIHLIVHGINARIISLDDYYRNRADMVPDASGKVDLETIDALDIKMFQNNMNELSTKGKTLIPSFDFTTATRRAELVPISLHESEVLIIEGIHGLNPLMTKGINEEFIYKIYISALTTINIDNHNRFSTTDTRLIRRISRDYHYRNSSASHTLNMWESVRSGEDKYIFPFQEEADVIFNSALIYEHGLFRSIAEPILRKIKKEDPVYCESKRLLDILSAFEKIDAFAVPPSSIIREFIGGSCFH